jgi:hypothetical protein
MLNRIVLFINYQSTSIISVLHQQRFSGTGSVWLTTCARMHPKLPTLPVHFNFTAQLDDGAVVSIPAG